MGMVLFILIPIGGRPDVNASNGWNGDNLAKPAVSRLSTEAIVYVTRIYALSWLRDGVSTYLLYFKLSSSTSVMVAHLRGRLGHVESGYSQRRSIAGR